MTRLEAVNVMADALKAKGVHNEPGTITDTGFAIVLDGAFYQVRLEYECGVNESDPWKGEAFDPRDVAILGGDPSL